MNIKTSGLRGIGNTVIMPNYRTLFLTGNLADKCEKKIR